MKAVIWDVDGVIFDTAPCHFRAWQEVFHRRGVRYTEEAFQRNFGLRNKETINNVMGQISPEEIESIGNEKELVFRRMIEQGIALFPGVTDLIMSLAKAGFKLALASSAPAENIRLSFRKLGIIDCFNSIVSGEDTSEGKPNPQCFLLAAERVGVSPQNCLVIEDAIAGVAAAKKAGMRCIAVTNTRARKDLSEADLVVENLEAVTVKDIESLIKKGRA